MITNIKIITHIPGPPNPGAIGNFDSKPGLDIVYLDFERNMLIPIMIRFI